MGCIKNVWHFFSFTGPSTQLFKISPGNQRFLRKSIGITISTPQIRSTGYSIQYCTNTKITRATNNGVRQFLPSRLYSGCPDSQARSLIPTCKLQSQTCWSPVRLPSKYVLQAFTLVDSTSGMLRPYSHTSLPF